MIGGDRHPSSAASTNTSNNSNQANAHNLIRSILFRHTHASNHSGTAKSDTATSRHPSGGTAAASTTSRTANSSLETSPNHPLYAARGQGTVGMRVTPHQPSSGGTSSGGNRKHFPKFPSLLLGHQGTNHHHRHQQYQPTTATTGNNNHNNPTVVRYAVPRKAGVWGRYHRTVGGLSSSGHRRAAAAAARRRQEAHKVATTSTTSTSNQVESSGEVARHAQIHPRPGVPQGQARAEATGNSNTNPQAANLVANLRHANHITADQPPYTNVPPHHQHPSTLPANAANTDPLLPKSSSSAAIPIPSHHIKRTASELQLCEDEMRAEYRDRVMYVRCYPAIAGATTARRATMQQATTAATAAQTLGIGHQQGQGQGMQHQDQVPTNNLIATAAAHRQATCRRSTAPPVLSHDSGDADWLLYDDHPLVGSSPSPCGVGAGVDTGSGAADVIERSANPRMSYADDVEAEVNVEVQVEPSPSSSPMVDNPTPPKDVKTTAGINHAKEGAGGGWPVACSQTRRNISILRQASETMYSTTKTSTTATTGTTTTPSSSNPASRATSRTTSREEADFDPYYQDDGGDGYLEGELHDYEHPDDPHHVGGGGPMPPKSADGGRRKNSASSYEDVFVIDDL